MFCFHFIQEFQNAAADRPFNLEAAIKSVEKMSNELKKLNGSSELITQLNKKLFKALFKKCEVVNGLYFLRGTAVF